MKYGIIGLFVLAASSAYAGNDVGNGGDAVVCFKSEKSRDYVSDILIKNRESKSPVPVFDEQSVRSSIKSVESFDYFEYTQPQGYPPVARNTIDDKGEPLKIVDFVLDRVKSKSNFDEPLRGEAAIYPLKNWQPAPGLPEIDDSGHVEYLPRNCLLVQIAVRVTGEKVYFDEYLFGRMNVLNRAALILHEWTYALTMKLGVDEPSKIARQIVGLFISKDEFESITPVELQQRLVAWGYSSARMPATGLPSGSSKITVAPTSLYESGSIKTGLGLSGEQEFMFGYRVPVSGLSLEFFPSGKIRKILETRNCSSFRFSADGAEYKTHYCPSEFYESGAPVDTLSLNAAGPERQLFEFADRFRTYAPELELNAHPNGELREIRLNRYNKVSEGWVKYRGNWLKSLHDARWHDNGQIRYFEPMFELPVSRGATCASLKPAFFYPNGRLSSCALAKSGKLPVGGRIVEFDFDSWIPTAFYPNGAVKSGYLNKKQSFRVGGKLIELDEYEYAEFSDTGELVGATLRKDEVQSVPARGRVVQTIPVEYHGVKFEVGEHVQWDRNGVICAGILASGIAEIDHQTYTDGDEINMGCKLHAPTNDADNVSLGLSQGRTPAM